MTASVKIQPIVHSYVIVNPEPPDDHHPVCSVINSNVCTCHHTELRMTPGYRPAKPVQLPCDEEP